MSDRYPNSVERDKQINMKVPRKLCFHGTWGCVIMGLVALIIIFSVLTARIQYRSLKGNSGLTVDEVS